MARKKRSGRRRAVVTIPDAQNIILGTLNNDTAVFGTSVPITDDFFCYSFDITATLRDLTLGQGPIQIGWCNADFSVAEVVEALDARPLGASDMIERERARRPVRVFGQFDGTAGGVATTTAYAERLNDGKTLRVKVMRKFTKNLGMVLFAVNRSGANLTTGGLVFNQVRWYGRWL